MTFSHKLMDDNITDKDVKSVKKLLDSRESRSSFGRLNLK